MQPKTNNAIIRLKLLDLLIEVSPIPLTIDELHKALISGGYPCSKKTVYNAIPDIREAFKCSAVYTVRDTEVRRGREVRTKAVYIDRIK